MCKRSYRSEARDYFPELKLNNQVVERAREWQYDTPYSKEEFAQRGDALYETQIRSQVEERNHGKIVAIRLSAMLRDQY
jgi:hypothetical protein